MRMLSIIAALLVAVAPPVFAQTPDAERTDRLELAERYLRITVGMDLGKYISRQMEASYSETDLPAEERAWLTQHMTAAFEEAMEATITDLRDDVADSFTREELESAIAFYDTPMGRSIARKSVELGGDMQEAMMPHMLTAMTSVGEKYCARFSCDAAAGAVMKQGVPAGAEPAVY